MTSTPAKGRDLTYGGNPTKLLRATAFHEAGHAVVGYRFGKWIRDRGISIDRDRPGDGHSHTRGGTLFPLSQAINDCHARYLRKQLRVECMEHLAGYAAEARVMRIRGLLGAGEDWENSIRLVEYVEECHEDDAEIKVLEEFVPAVRRLLRNPTIWKTVSMLAEALIARGAISSEEAQALLEKSDVHPVPLTYWGRTGQTPMLN